VPSHGKGRGDRNPSLRISDGDIKLLVHCYSGCDRVDVLDELRRRGLLDRAQVRTVAKRAHAHALKPADGDAHGRQQHHKAAWLWSQRRPIAGTIAERYLREARGITCALPRTLAYLPARKPDQHPAMIAAFAMPDEPESGVVGEPHAVEAVHLTLLKPDGTGKADLPQPKIMVGSPGILPIVIAPPNDLLALAVVEGIEDALSVHQATGLGVWAAGAAGRMPGLAKAVPDYVDCVTIFADGDTAGTNNSALLAEALDARNFAVEILRLAEARQ
jgi:hypothetical protein